MGIFDTSSSTFTLVDISTTINRDDKFSGAAAVGSLVVFAPRNADGVGIFDTSSSTFTLVDISATIMGTHGRIMGGLLGDDKFSGAAAMGTSVFFPQHDAKGIGVFDVVTHDFSILDMYGRFEGSALFYGATSVGNTVVFAPQNEDAVAALTVEYCSDDALACPTGSYRAACGHDPSTCAPANCKVAYQACPCNPSTQFCPPATCNPLTHASDGLALLAVAQLKGACTPCTASVTSITYYTSHGGVEDACPTAPCNNVTCPAGHFRSGNCGDDATRSNNDFLCEPCPPGTHEPASSSSTQCMRCASGTYQPLWGATNCQICSDRSYCTEGSSNPLGCESGMAIANAVTPHQGATSWEACVCKTGFYDDGRGSDRVNCILCPSGSDCSQSVGVDLASLPVKRGYYRLNESSIDVRRCPDAATNCTGSPECLESTSGCRGTVNQSALAVAGRRLDGDDDDERTRGALGCVEGLSGTFCRLCLPHAEGKRVFYSAATTSAQAHCAECRDSARNTILLAVGVLLVAAVLGMLILDGYRACASDAFKAKLRVAWHTFTPHIKLKILIGFYMVATKLDSVYEVELPATVKQLLAAFAIGVSFGVNGVSTVLECLDMRGYAATLAVYMLVPPAIAALIVLAVVLRLLCMCRLSVTVLLETAVPLLLQLGFLAYPLVTNVAFDAFSCYTFSDSEWLKADVAIQCGTPEHDSVKRLAWLAILLYPIGLLVLYGALLFAARHAIQANRPTFLSRAIGFLYREYEVSLFWWELVEMLRRLVLVGMMVLAQGSMMQLVVGSLLAAAFLLFQVQAAPYLEMADDFLASASSFGLVAMFICATAFKNIALTDLSDVQEKMSTEQKELYVISSGGLAFIMLGSVLGALVLSIVLFVFRFITESARLRREALASKARRLRYKESGTEARVAAVGARHFHTFLSHVWGTGQDQMRIVKQRLLEMLPELSVFLDVDDLEEIGDLEGYIERTTTILVYCSRGYFTSKNCMRELVSSMIKEKPIIALIDPDASHGGLSLDECHAQLLEADAMYAKWGFNTEPDAPLGRTLYNHLFKYEPIEWNRIGHFQDVTMRLIAERLMPPGSASTTYVDRELVTSKLRPLPPCRKSFHIYCSSAHNPGAKAFLEEVSRERGFALHVDTRTAMARPNELCVATEKTQLEDCDQMLLYLTAQTWTRGDGGSAALGEEVKRAMDLDMNVLLAHEMPGAGGQAERFGCEFGTFFSCPDGATPPELLKRGIYSTIAVPLKGGAWREASMALMGMALGMSKDQAEGAMEGADVLGLEASTSIVAASGSAFARLRRGSSSQLRKLHSSVLSFRRAGGGGKAEHPPSYTSTAAMHLDVATVSSASADVEGDGMAFCDL